MPETPEGLYQKTQCCISNGREVLDNGGKITNEMLFSGLVPFSETEDQLRKGAGQVPDLILQLQERLRKEGFILQTTTRIDRLGSGKNPGGCRQGDKFLRRIAHIMKSVN